MYRVEFHCRRCNRIYQLPMVGGICPNDAAFLDLEFVTLAVKREPE